MTAHITARGSGPATRVTGAAVEVSGLRKRFGRAVAVDDVSFTVAYGRITGFLGPNGAGKTTTLRMLLGLIRPDAGTAVIAGEPYPNLASPARTVGLAVSGITAAIALPLLAGRHIPAGVSGAGIAAIIGGCGIATALCAAIGVGVGAIVRSQVGAIITVLAVLYVAEPLLGFIPHLGTAIQRYGLGGLAAAATHTTGYPSTAHLLGQAAAALVLAGYATAALLAGAALLHRRDITA